MNGIFDLNSTDDSTAWQRARDIRSHRAPRRQHRTTRRISLTLAAVLAVGALAPLSEGVATPPASSEAYAAVEAVPVTVEPVAVRKLNMTRSVRAVSARTVKINKAINFALAQRGDRYKWGASGPRKWDCSGLIMKSYQKAGKKLPHQTGGIQKKGKKVSKKNLKRGDIIFPQRGHVGIYLGNGKMVHASSGKGKVVVAKVYGFYTARRVI